MDKNNFGVGRGMGTGEGLEWGGGVGGVGRVMHRCFKTYVSCSYLWRTAISIVCEV